MEYFFKRLEKYIEVRPTAAMTDIIVKIMVEVLSILGIVTKEIGQGISSMSSHVDISQNRPSCREVLQEAGWNKGRRGCASATRQINARGGSDGRSRNPDEHSQNWLQDGRRRPQSRFSD